jgi:predicted  nucleic acid-binding Zn-ribbon protein
LYVNLKRGQAESIKEFLQINIDALDKAVAHLNKDTERSKEEVEDLQNRCISVKDQIQEVLTQIEEKIKNNPA